MKHDEKSTNNAEKVESQEQDQTTDRRRFLKVGGAVAAVAAGLYAAPRVVKAESSGGTSPVPQGRADEDTPSGGKSKG